VSEATENEVDLKQSKIYDHNITEGYVTYIVDMWEGDEKDPTVGISRYVGVWRAEQLEVDDVAIDPDFWGSARMQRYTYRNSPTPQPLVWELMEEIKTPDKELVKFKRDQEHALHKPSYGSGGAVRRADLYNEFLRAIDFIAKYPNSDNKAQWDAIEAYRGYNARLHER
jgi:hypothetical protein